MTWNGTLSSSYDMVFQLATDEAFRERVNILDTRVDSNFTTSSGSYSLIGGDSLELGNMYFWRFAHIESDGRMGPWESSSFFVSDLSSTWLGGNRYEFRLKHGNGHKMDNSQNVVIHTSIQVHQLQIMMMKVRCRFLGTLGLVKPQSYQDVIYYPTCYLPDMQWNMQHTPCN